MRKHDFSWFKTASSIALLWGMGQTCVWAQATAEPAQRDGGVAVGEFASSLATPTPRAYSAPAPSESIITPAEPFMPMFGSRWMVPYGTVPYLEIRHNKLRVTSVDNSLVLLAHDIQGAGVAAEVRLLSSPASSSAICGLGVMADSEHALVIGVANGEIVLWKLGVQEAGILARKLVGHDLNLELRVTGGSAQEIRFYWRHHNEQTWHAMSAPAEQMNVTDGTSTLRFGLLMDGPLGSMAEFADYREFGVQ